MHNKFTFQLVAICCLLSLIACQPSISPLAELSPSKEATVMVLPVATHTLRPSPTTVPTPATPTTITLVPTIVPTVTMIPLPTLPPDEALNRVLELYETNGGCQYPCWWGITPGEITWADAHHFLSALASRIYVQPGPNNPDILAAEVFLPQVETMETGRYNIHVYVIKNGIVDMIQALAEPAASLAPGAILHTYGLPDEVYLRGSTDAISFSLFYQNQSFLLQYVTEDITVEDESLKVCFSDKNTDSARIVVWPLVEERSFSEVYGQPDSIMYEYPLAEVTDLDIQGFYGLFSDPAVPTCLETPVEYWLNF